jgi:hypothetical protein
VCPLKFQSEVTLDLTDQRALKDECLPTVTAQELLAPLFGSGKSCCSCLYIKDVPLQAQGALEFFFVGFDDVQTSASSTGLSTCRCKVDVDFPCRETGEVSESTKDQEKPTSDMFLSLRWNCICWIADFKAQLAYTGFVFCFQLDSSDRNSTPILAFGQ